MREYSDPKDKSDEHDRDTPRDRPIEDSPDQGIGQPIDYPVPTPSYRWEDTGELHGEETGGQEP
jgi:hypothetical protein